MLHAIYFGVTFALLVAVFVFGPEDPHDVEIAPVVGAFAWPIALPIVIFILAAYGVSWVLRHRLGSSC